LHGIQEREALLDCADPEISIVQKDSDQTIGIRSAAARMAVSEFWRAATTDPGLFL